ncbi:amino acid/amide ABC transporter substrate-binding protein (HAAT family) [Branchiibius hedensis]|uniref:Amino acid/amide ABC transporter substrate-binding protein, HAAT family n=1 Tax=Branchiibius hedensis TaxID=672460 RepID=A0A2Y9A123_9MICO|nr:ABC transporter substrate-binding protein [Branchiibius hedensis]PWJ27066.1 amino acid/amide ABC transporter substrate-binding protein (HAAT family) [Branchiibius hedensis]SSA35877.1 amino acid/amide ABC transporter substrate-binding protein, HAAT family [Branchiibius hedensis]
MKIRAVRIVAVAVAAASLSLAGCGSSSDSSSGSSGGAGDPFKLLVSGAASGPLAAQGSTAINAAKAAADKVNSEGGVAGRKIQVTVVDDQGDPTTAVSVLQQAIAKGKPDAYMNSGPSTIAAATLPILTNNKILSFNTGPTADSDNPAKYPYNFDLAQDAGTGVKGIAEELKSKGYKKIGVIHGNSAYGQTFGKLAQSTLSDMGMTVVANQEYDTTALDMTPQLENVKSANPDAVVLDAYGAPVGYVLKGVEKLNWTVPIYGNTSVTATSLTGMRAPQGILGTKGAENLLVEATPSSVFDAKATDVNQAVAAMAKLAPIQTSVILAVNYDGVLLIKAAADKVGAANDSTKLAQALTDSQVQKDAKTVITPLYAYTATKHAPSAGLDKTIYIFVQPAPVKNGQIHPES